MKIGVTKISSKGQIVIPLDFRDKMVLKEGDVFSIFEDSGLIVLKKVEDSLNSGDVNVLENLKKALLGKHDEESKPSHRSYIH
ncbi:MAG: AbrB/MazE/SpoVT family DNA-binding domain-containing protein [Nanoarchaeota archaeon]